MDQDPINSPQTIQPRVEITASPALPPSSTVVPSDKKAPLYGSVGVDPRGIQKIPSGIRGIVMLIISGPVILFVAMILNVLLQLLAPADSILFRIASTALWILGFIGVIMILVGPIVGIIKLLKR